MAISTFSTARFLPDHRPRGYATPDPITFYAYAPAVAWAFLGPMTQGDNPQGATVWPNWASHLVPRFAEDARSTFLLLAAYFIALSLGYAAAALAHGRDRGGGLFRLNALAWLAASVVSAGIVYCGAALAHAIPASDQAQALAVFGPLWLLGAAGIQTAIYVGFRRDGGLLDLDREWFARLSALKLRAGALWAAFACACLVLSWAVNRHGGPVMAGLISSLAAGPAGAWLGKQARSQVEALVARKGAGRLPFNLLADVLAGVFLIALIALFGFAIDTYLLGSVMQETIADQWIRGCQPPVGPITSGLAQRFNPPTELIEPYCEESLLQPFAAVLALFLMLLAVAWLIGRFVNVNRYTMHAVYRNRLTRAFLGSACAGRHAEPFSEFDPADNVPLAGLKRGRAQKLFPVINMTLNQTYGGAAAWSDRKALAFTATPLACGAPNLGGADERASPGAYVPTRLYAGRESPAHPGQNDGLTLATAMAISGAAVSPNWGYHSSPLTAFIMTLFNVRLGAWLPNPAAPLSAEKLALAMPPDRLRSLAGDLLGVSTTTDPAIYLSDGGHFDNLGLYEMLRRRCRLILVIDAGEDGSCTYQDLGNALRKAAIDMGITVEFQAPWRIAARTAGERERQEALGFLIGRIEYPDAAPGEEGQILYLKPSLLNDAPADVRAYANLNPQFPHEPTLDQWFTEAQFESYRKLGEFQVGRLLRRCWGGPDGGIDLPDLFAATARADVRAARRGGLVRPVDAKLQAEEASRRAGHREWER